MVMQIITPCFYLKGFLEISPIKDPITAPIVGDVLFVVEGVGGVCDVEETGGVGDGGGVEWWRCWRCKIKNGCPYIKIIITNNV